MSELIAESLELLSESDVDIYGKMERWKDGKMERWKDGKMERWKDGKVYEHFFRINPGAEELMTHLDELTRGRMLEEVTRLFMVDDLAAESASVTFEYNNHKTAYSVQSNMYRELFDAFATAVKEVVGGGWRPEFDNAWMSRAMELEQAFDLS